MGCVLTKHILVRVSLLGESDEHQNVVRYMFRQSMQDLAHIHSLDIAHRDINPQNVLISVPNKNGNNL